jgi:hypothetical protein
MFQRDNDESYLDRDSFIKKFFIYGLIIIVLLILFFKYIPYEISEKTQLYLPITSLVILLANVYIGIQTYRMTLEDRNKNKGIQYSSICQSKYNDVDKLLYENPNLIRLYYEMNKSDAYLAPLLFQKIPNQISDDMKVAEHYASTIIFQNVSNIYVSEKLHIPSDNSIEWIVLFKLWFKSDILKKLWENNKFRYNPEVREFIRREIIKIKPGKQ